MRRAKTSRSFRVLLIDADPHSRDAFARAAAADPSLKFKPVTSVQEARKCLGQGHADLLLIEPDLDSGSGLALAQEIARTRPQTQTVLLSSPPDSQRALQALRLGVSDFLVKPVTREQAGSALEQARLRHRLDRKRLRQVHKLRRMCRKLNEARTEISRQVDVLCNDLVNAYQELSSQMTQAVCASEFSGIIRSELDLHATMHHALDYLLRKAGPTNAALFLPAMPDHFAVGAYVNYDCSVGSADVLLNHLANVVAPKVATQNQPTLITDNAALAQLIGDDWNYLADAHVACVACRHKDEALAVLVLFRDGQEPFTPALLENLGIIAPILGDHLARIVRIHHRHLPDIDLNPGA